MDKNSIDALIARFEGTGVTGPGNPRIKTIVNRLLRDFMCTMEDLDIQPEEFWAGLNYLAEAGRSGELGLIVPGIGLEHFMDLRMDEAEARAGLAGGTPRTIEGPLYVAGAPEVRGSARLDDGTQPGEVVVMHGVVRDDQGLPLAGAKVEVWHANHLGNYSHFDKTQSDFNLRRTLITDAEGRYRFRSIMPLGYSVPPGGATDRLLTQLGRHGHRPAHIHFFVCATGCRKLTTQINIESDPHLWDDFAFGTRDGLVPPIRLNADPAAMRALEVDRPFHEIEFDFTLHADQAHAPATDFDRPRAAA
ncbi:catechol 1,2-dioxygenase [Sphaerotilus hippei]|uniref:catechol 1,2-dioxygenase n=1 Tax=Sphaerotilus hippei TaxID=744406 RepID=A0A318H263_9BURK|nr:catechol 1,2-dioxygenase [Sphaerotilus hippei]PXW97429.1 catechol 1,2-dioxygenase [Sphaerotilus hippei]